MNDRERLRVSLDGGQARFNGKQELVAESIAPRFVPRERFGQISLGFRPNEEPFGHPLRWMRALIVFQDEPGAVRLR